MEAPRDHLASRLNGSQGHEFGRSHRGSIQATGCVEDHLHGCASSAILRLDMALQTAPSREDDYQRTAVIGRALADPKRLRVLASLADGEVSVSDLSTRVVCQVPNMSKLLAARRAAGLVTTLRDGSTVYYRLAD